MGQLASRFTVPARLDRWRRAAGRSVAGAALITSAGPISADLNLGFDLVPNLVGGVSWSSAGWHRAYFGISPQSAAASGLAAFTPGSGVRQWYVWPAVMVLRVALQWLVAATAFHQRLTGDAANSPISGTRELPASRGGSVQMLAIRPPSMRMIEPVM